MENVLPSEPRSDDALKMFILEILAISSRIYFIAHEGALLSGQPILLEHARAVERRLVRIA